MKGNPGFLPSIPASLRYARAAMERLADDPDVVALREAGGALRPRAALMAGGARAFVLAAGLGTRLRPLTETWPKPAVPLLGSPLLRRTLRCSREPAWTASRSTPTTFRR